MGNTTGNHAIVIRACLVLGIACMFTTIPVIGARRRLEGETVFDITQYGGKADGKTDNAMAIIKAWKAACGAPAPAKVVIPPGDFRAGEVVLAGPCTAPPPITVEIQGTLSANPDPSSYSGEAWVKVEHVDNVIVTGSGTVNGHGQDVWQYATDDSHLPVSLMFQRVGNSQISNLHVVDSMGFHTKVTDSHDIVVTNVTITAPGDSPNTDGLHVSSTSNLNFTDSVVATGDDCVSIGEGSTNVFVARITCGPGHGLSVGSLGKRPDELDVKGITITNCTLTGTTNGARIKTFHKSPKLSASGIVFQDIVMNDVKNPIIIDQHYSSRHLPEQSNVKITDAHFINIRGTSISPVAVTLNCSLTAPCEGIELADINLTPSANVTKPLSTACEKAKLNLVGNLFPPGPTCA